MTKVLNSQSNPLTEKASVSFRTLRGTMLETKADVSKERNAQNENEMDLNSCLGKIKNDIKHGNAMLRSTRIRKSCNYLPENSVKQRKSYFCTPETGYFTQKVEFNQMAML